MSYTSVPKITLPKHNSSNALEVALSAEFGPAFFASLKKSTFGKKALATCNPMMENILRKWDKYMATAATELWTATSFYTGNTRGSLKQTGSSYKDYNIEFDEDEWFRVKTLPSLKEKRVEREWFSGKGSVYRHRAYTYPAGRMTRVGGSDYAPRIPRPPHGRGPVSDLIATYEEMKKTEIRKAGFHVR